MFKVAQGVLYIFMKMIQNAFSPLAFALIDLVWQVSADWATPRRASWSPKSITDQGWYQNDLCGMRKSPVHKGHRTPSCLTRCMFGHLDPNLHFYSDKHFSNSPFTAHMRRLRRKVSGHAHHNRWRWRRLPEWVIWVKRVEWMCTLKLPWSATSVQKHP